MTEKTHETSVVLLESMTLNHQEKLSAKEQLTNLFNIVKDVEILTKEKYFIAEIKTQEDHEIRTFNSQQVKQMDLENFLNCIKNDANVEIEIKVEPLKFELTEL